MDEPVAVTTVSSEVEADMVCGFLRAAGMEAGFRQGTTTDSSFGGALAARIEVLVHPADAERARQVLAEVEADAEAEAEAGAEPAED